jgi:MFS family permease
MARPAVAVTPQRVIRTYLTLAGIYTLSASLIWGVNTLFLLDAGLDIAQVFVANAAFTAAMVVFEIPTGVVADTLGRRTSFLVSISVLLVSTIAYVVVGVEHLGLGAFVLASIALGLGFTFYSGATEAWLVDALRATGYTGPLDAVFSRAQLVTGAAMLVGTVSGGLLGTIDLALPFVVRAGLLVPVLVIAGRLMHDLGFQPRPLTRANFAREVSAVARTSADYGWRNQPMRLLVLVSFFQTGFFIWGWYAWQPYLLGLLGRREIWITGVISGAMALSMMAGNALVDPLGRRTTRRTTIMFGASVVQTGAAVAIGLVHGFGPATAMLLLFGVAVGVMTPVKQAYLHETIPSAQRATLVSFDSLVGDLGSVGGQVVLGKVARDRGIADGYVLGGLGTIVAVPLVLLLRRASARGGADDIGGGPCAEPAAQAAQGLPVLCQVGTPEPAAGAGDHLAG